MMSTVILVRIQRCDWQKFTVSTKMIKMVSAFTRNGKITNGYCKIGNFREGFIFCETLHMQNFVKIKPSGNGEIILSFTDIGKSCPSHEF